MSFSYFLEQVISGIVIGSSYALVGAGLSMIWGTLKMINIAHGDLYMMAAYFLWLSVVVGKLPLLLALAVALICTLVLSALIQIALIRPLLRKEGWDMSPYILTMGVSIFLQNMALRMWGERFQNVPYFSNQVIKLFNMVSISSQRIIIIIVALVIITGFMITIRYTRLGRAIRATSQDMQSALMMGINVKSVYLMTYVISGGLAAVAGIILAPIYSVNPWMGITVQAKGQVVCILGGLGSIEGAIIGGVIIGICESLAVTWLGSGWKDVVAYLLMVVVLWVRPSGLFGKKES
jgi:branched-chain amino acid transport system permease protein